LKTSEPNLEKIHNLLAVPSRKEQQIRNVGGRGILDGSSMTGRIVNQRKPKPGIIRGADFLGIKGVWLWLAGWSNQRDSGRFLIEHYAGNFPLWLAPDQVRVITLNDDEALINYAKPIVAELRANMVRVDADFSATPFKAKISNAEL